MKKILSFTTLLVLGLSFQVHAQFRAGGSIGFSKQSTLQEMSGTEAKVIVNNFTLVPRLGYVFGDFWAGIEGGVTSVKTEHSAFPIENHFVSKAHIATISPFFRYTKKPVQNMGVWVEAQAGAIFGKSSVEGTVLQNYKGFNAGLRPGVVFFVNKQLSFEASFGSLGYTRFVTTDAQNSRNKETTENLGFSLNNTLVLDQTAVSLTSGFLFGVNWTFPEPEAEK